MVRIARPRAVSVLLIAGLLATGCGAQRPEAASPARVQAVAPSPAPVALEPLEIQTADGPVRFQVEIADTAASREQGLMYRQTMPAGQGMLFQFPNTRFQAFWMKNTYIPLDIIFIAPDGRIANVAAMTTPFSEAPVPSTEPVNGVLEIGGGLAAKLGVKPGDVVRHPFFRTGG